jgi:hydrogenase maturation protease
LKMTNRTLVIGYGNPYRRDDGVAFHVVNDLRQRLGAPSLQPDEDGLDDLGRGVDTIMLHQLIPEIAPALEDYGTIVFVDAHTGAITEDVRLITVEEDYGFQAVTHHMSPGMLLTLARAANGKAPVGYLVSIRGYDFDFGQEISEACKANAKVATQKILDMTKSENGE